MSGQIPKVHGNFGKMVEQVQQTPIDITKNVKKLTTFLIAPAENDYEKMAGIYHWITNNIEYDKTAYTADFYRINKTNEDILNRQKAICFGYATLLEEMCTYANIESHLIIGYAKGTHSSSDDYDEINHAWNAVKLENDWYLIDATWAAGSQNESQNFSNQYDRSYFCSSPESFVKNHLPAYNIWQLLDCPVTFQTFKKSSFTVKKGKENNINFRDSIAKFQKLTWYERRIKTMEAAYLENPVPKNKRELAQTYMDLEGNLSDLVAKLHEKGLEDSIFMIQAQMIQLCQEASQLTTLYNNQVENCAYTYINQGVAISRRKNNMEKADLELMLNYFKNAQQFLESLSSSMFIEQGIEQCKNYIDFTETELKSY
ncbi:MAG: transglutaminase domain-containing protein [Saprospiraceae bacterium]